MPWNQPEIEAVASLVSQRTGLAFGNRQDSAETTIRNAMAKAHTRDVADYIDRLQCNAGALDELIDELTVGETYFFREPAQFEWIRREVIPEVLQRRGLDHAPRAWSAGCASGEEAYTLAILFAQAGVGDRVHLVATDISRAALAKARQARYGRWSLRGGAGEATLPYLTPEGNLYQVQDRVRNRVTFSHLNLALDVYPSFAAGIWGLDLILCRNVLIYFDRRTIARVAQRLYASLAEGGWLIAASSDPPLWDDAPFEVVSSPEGVFYRRSPSPAMSAAIGGGQVAEEESPPPQATHQEPPPIAALMVGLDGPDEAATAIKHVRGLAVVDTGAAAEACERAVSRHPLCAELHYLYAVILWDLGKPAEAARAMRRVLYLDRTLAVAHFTLGAILRQSGERAAAARAYRNSRDLCAARPAEERVPLADGETAGRMAEIAAAELVLLESS